MLKLINTPLYQRHEKLCQELGLDVVDGEVRADAAGDTMHLARELEFNSAQSVEVLTDPIKGRQFVNFTTIPEGAETFSYDMWDKLAMAEWITNYASSVGSADAFRKRFYKPMYDFGSSYHYSVQDLAKAAYARQPLDRKRAAACRVAHEQFLDNLIATGDADREIEGLCNSTAFQAVQSTVGEWDFSDPEPVDPDDYEAKSHALYNDLNKLVDAIEQNSAENFSADTVILPLSMKPVLGRKFSRYEPRTRLQVWLDAHPGVSVNFWKRLNTASALGGPKGLAYKKSPQVLEFVLSYDFKEMPPQVTGFAYKINTYARVGGLVVRYALACASMDFDEDLTP